MSYQKFIGSVFLLTFIISAGKLTSQNYTKAKESNRPNIIFILTDDQRFDALGYAGNKGVVTEYM